MRIAVIPARGGSKRIPKKNINLFCGKPIIAWSINAAISSGLFDEIIVSTDDDEIAAVAKKYGASVPFMRPQEISGDYTETNEVVKHAINWCKDNDQTIDYVCCIYATAPFLSASSLKLGYEKLLASKGLFSFSATSFPFPILRSIKIKRDDTVEAIWPENISVRSQDMEEAYHDAGQFYWGTANAFLDDEVMFSPVSVAVIIPRHLVQNIDTLEDWKRAEIMLKILLESGEISS